MILVTGADRNGWQRGAAGPPGAPVRQGGLVHSESSAYDAEPRSLDEFVRHHAAALSGG